MFERLSSLEIDEQRDGSHDQNERNDHSGDERDFDEGRGSVLSIGGHLL